MSGACADMQKPRRRSRRQARGGGTHRHPCPAGWITNGQSRAKERRNREDASESGLEDISEGRRRPVFGPHPPLFASIPPGSPNDRESPHHVARSARRQSGQANITTWLLPTGRQGYRCHDRRGARSSDCHGAGTRRLGLLHLRVPEQHLSAGSRILRLPGGYGRYLQLELLLQRLLLDLLRVLL